MIKIGDWVIVTPNNCYTCTKAGAIGRVIMMDDDYIRCDWIISTLSNVTQEEQNSIMQESELWEISVEFVTSITNNKLLNILYGLQGEDNVQKDL